MLLLIGQDSVLGLKTMFTAQESLPFIGRADLLQALMERLQRPDDLRNNPEAFIRPGFFGLAGTGKSRLLHEAAQNGKTLTPYVVRVDFDPRAGSAIPSTPLRLLQQLIDDLEECDRANSSILRRFFWRWKNPFIECRQIINRQDPNSITQIITLTGTQAANISQGINLGSRVPENLDQAFTAALSRLHVKHKTKILFGDSSGEKKCPLILVLLDTAELAPRPIREWLPEIHHLARGKNTLSFNLMFVVAGRYQQDGLLDTQLPPLALTEARNFIHEYALLLLGRSQRQLRSDALNQLIQSEEAQHNLVLQGQGIPLLLQLLVETAALSSGTEMSSNGQLPSQHDAIVSFVIENYLERLKNQAYLQKDDQLWSHYYLLLYCAVPRRIPNSDFLRTLLIDLQGTSFGQRTNYDELFEELSHEGFVERTAANALVLHSLIREGIVFYLRANNPKLLTEIHQRAADWFDEFGDRTSSLYHRLRSEPAQGLKQLKKDVADAMKRQRWVEVQELLGAAGAVQLGKPDEYWITIFKADLAWVEHNQDLALERLRGLYNQESISALGGEIAKRLELWLGFGAELENELKHGPSRVQGHLPDLLWWSKQRKLPAITIQALRLLGEAAIADGELEDAQELIKDSVRLAQRIGDERACAGGFQTLGELALALGPISKAASLFQKAIDLFRKLKQPEKEANAQFGKAVALFYTAQQSDAQQLLELTLASQKELKDFSGEAHTLRTLGHLHYLMLGSEGFEKADELLEQALELFQKVGDSLGQARTLLLRADLSFEVSRRHGGSSPFAGHDIRNLYVASAEHFKTTDDRLGSAKTQYALGILAGMRIHEAVVHADSHFDIAVMHLRQAKSLFHAGGDPLSQAHTEVAMGAMLYTMWKQHDKAKGQAMDALEDAREIYEKHGDNMGRANVLFVLGQIALWRLDYDEAKNLLTRASQLCALVKTDFSKSVQEWIATFIQIATEKSSLPDKSVMHIGFVARSRLMDLTGWSVALRQEDTANLVITETPDPFRRGFRDFHRL